MCGRLENRNFPVVTLRKFLFFTLQENLRRDRPAAPEAARRRRSIHISAYKAGFLETVYGIY